MKKFKYNYKKNDYDRVKEQLKKKYKGRDTLKNLILRKIDTSQKYEIAIDSFMNFSQKPDGLELDMINNTILLESAKDQIMKISTRIIDIEKNDLITNYRFYINTPYFDRNGSDPYPLFKLGDSRVNHISDLVFEALNLMNISSFDKDLLNIIIRIYRPGDVLNFHTDRDLFGENIYGIALLNSDISRGLMLKNKKYSYMLDEKKGAVWKLSGDSRWDYEHGYCTNFHLTDDFLRISITFRFFGDKSQIPKKEYEN